MNSSAIARLLAASVILIGLLAWAGTLPPDADLLAAAKEYFEPLPKVMASADNPLSDVKVQLGKMLYYEPRLSKSGVIMGESQLDEEIPEPEREALVAFLNSLTGEIPRDALQLPVLPPSTEQTSRPDVS